MSRPCGSSEVALPAAVSSLETAGVRLDRRAVLSSALGAVSLLSGCESAPREYPGRDIKLVVQAAPGGLSDMVSRVIGSQVEAALGVPVVCENKPGAAGALAFSYVSRRPADGYTLAHAPVELAILKTLGYTQVSPDSVDALCLVSKTRPVLVVSASSGPPDFEAFLKMMRARPGHYIAGNSGTGSIWHLNALLMEQALSLHLIHVPFPGSSASVTNLMGGHIDVAVMGVGEAIAQILAGSLRALAVFDTSRSPLLPDVPCVQEFGEPFGALAWSGFFGPKGLPSAVHERLAPAFRAAYESRIFQDLCKERGMEAAWLGQQEFARFAAEQAEFFANRVPRLLGVKE
jgi:tripartite-type tricarboxylate transporter receptor subunit TctC